MKFQKSEEKASRQEKTDNIQKLKIRMAWKFLTATPEARTQGTMPQNSHEK